VCGGGGSQVKLPCAITNTRLCFGNNDDLFDYQKSWGLELGKKKGTGTVGKRAGKNFRKLGL
jgi:hypothetical protein